MGGNLGMIIPTLIGQNRQAELAEQQQDNQAVDQQVAMYNYIIQDPGAPPQLKDPAIQGMLDLVEDHGGKEVQDSLPQIGSILTNLSKQSIMKGHAQKLQKLAQAAPPQQRPAAAPEIQPAQGSPDLDTLANLPQQRTPWPGLQTLAGIHPSPSQAESVTSNQFGSDIDTPIFTRTPPGSDNIDTPLTRTPPPGSENIDKPLTRTPPSQQQPEQAPPSRPLPVQQPPQPHPSRMQRFLGGMGAFGAGLQGYSKWADQKRAQIENAAVQQRALQQYQTRSQIIDQAERAGQITSDQAQEARMANITGIRSNLAQLNESPMMARLQSGKTIPILRSKQGEIIDANTKQPLSVAYPNDPMVAWGTYQQMVGSAGGGLTGEPKAVEWANGILDNPQAHTPVEVQTAKLIRERWDQESQARGLNIEAKKEQTQKLPPETVKYWAEMAINNGGIIPTGMARYLKSAGVAQIMSAIPEIAKERGMSIGDMLGTKADRAALQKALTQMEGSYEQVKTFEKTASVNLDRAVAAGAQLVDKGSPFVNRPVREVLKELAGKPEYAAFDAAQRAAVSEVSKVLSGSVGNGAVSDSARAEAEGLLKRDYTLAQLIAASDMLKADMQSRTQNMQDTIFEIRLKIASPDPTRGMVRMQAPPGPDGSPGPIKEVEASQVEHYRQLGATIVKQ